jgi:hypothetical protein
MQNANTSAYAFQSQIKLEIHQVGLQLQMK